MKRACYIDNLRIALTALVIVHHTAIAYGASGGWCYITPDTIGGWGQMILSAFLTVNQAFFMSFFFFISAVFTPESYDRKGFSRYMKDRLVRLGIPLVVYSTIIGPWLNYGILLHTHRETGGNLLEFIVRSNLTNPNTSHLWFLLALLVFESTYAVYRKWSKWPVSSFVSDKLPTQRVVLSFIILSGLLAFLLRIVYPIGGKNFIGLQFGYFVLYTALYLTGLLAGRKKWLDQISLASYRPLVVLAFLAIPLIFLTWAHVTEHPEHIVQYIGGANWRALYLACWEAFVCVGLIVFLTAVFKAYFNRSSALSLQLSLSSYAAYILHPLLVVGLTMFFETVPAPPFYKFVGAGVLGVTLSFLLAYLIRLIPGMRKVI